MERTKMVEWINLNGYYESTQPGEIKGDNPKKKKNRAREREPKAHSKVIVWIMCTMFQSLRNHARDQKYGRNSGGSTNIIKIRKFLSIFCVIANFYSSDVCSMPFFVSQNHYHIMQYLPEKIYCH